jgi:O-antigen ligase
MKTESRLSSLYFISLPFLMLIPNWTVIDIKGMLWFYMSILNTLFIVYIIILRPQKTFEFLKEKSFISFSFFFLISSLSTIVAINKAESLMRITDFYVILSTLFVMLYFIYNNAIKSKTILIIVLSSLILEIMGSYFQLYQIFDFNGVFIAEDGGSVKSVYPNRNMASFVFVVKIFLISILVNLTKSKILKFLIFIINLSTLYIVLLMSSRAVLLILFLIFIITVLSLVFKNFINKKSIKNDLSSLKYFILPLISAIVIFNLTITEDPELKVNNRVNSTFSQSDESVNNRLRFYSHAFTQIKSTPFLGVGVGNWRIKSIDYDKENMFSYVVPYSVHNDFLEVFAETGFFGFISFFLFFYFIFIKIFRGFLKWLNTQKNISLVYLLFAFLIMIGDFSLNFPLDRPSTLITYLLFFSVYKTIDTQNK